jgi:hypothetical protein
LGIIGEYIGRIFNEIKPRPMYLIEETCNVDNEFGDENYSTQSMVAAALNSKAMTAIEVG